MLDRLQPSGGRPGIVDDPAFQALVRERTRFAWTLSALMLGVYLAFVLLAAFDKGFMAATIGDTSISWGIALGLFTIVFAFALTGVYVARANGRFDELSERIGRGRR